MAWISVHEQVIGGKLRNFAKEAGCSQNEALGLLVRFWIWGINNADKEGRIIGAEKSDIAEVLTIGLDNRYSPDKVVDAMISTNWIDMENGLYIHDWEEWQEQWYKALEVRKKDAERKRKERRKRLGNAADAPDTTPPSAEKEMEKDLPSLKRIIPHKEEQQRQPAAVSYIRDFEEFWNIYPRKSEKGNAYRKYHARLKDGWSPAELLEAARNYAADCERNKTEKEYIKHAKTFLSDSTPFTDFLPGKGDSIFEEKSEDDNDPYGEWR